jgi:NADH:ubiquinone oxidoreductase subunit E
MKRYDVEHTVWGDLSIVQRSNGEWVKWDDVEKVIHALKESRDLIEGVCEEYRAYRPLLNKIDKVLNNIEGTK